MKFRTEYIGKSKGLEMGIDRPVALMGSCFTDYIGARMRQCLWDARNYTGVLFNPMSIATALRCALSHGRRKEALEASVFSHEGMWKSWLCDSSATTSSRQSTLARLNENFKGLESALDRGATLIVTFGTAWCYFLRESSLGIVANCHKMPGEMFERRRVSIDEITECWTGVLHELAARFADINVIFTVSPVRHVRDGLHENQLSKATLLLAVDELCHRHDFCHYFPAYEIVNDDLRDYRFYESDLVHPNSMAVEYIWEKFQETCMAEPARAVLREGEAIYRRFSHRSIVADAPGSAEFREKSLALLKTFRDLHPAILTNEFQGL